MKNPPPSSVEDSRARIAALRDVVSRALDEADALGLDWVGIDLNEARERLNQELGEEPGQPYRNP